LEEAGSGQGGAGIPGFILGIGGRKNGELWKVAQINRLQKLERVKGIEPSLRFTSFIWPVSLFLHQEK
jgi:hypothetical protein